MSDHGALTGLSDDDHSQYVLADGSRDITGNQTVNGVVTAEDFVDDADNTAIKLLDANKTFYVRTTGSDSNNGLSAQYAFLTFERAIEETQKWRTGDKSITINVGSGNYTKTSHIDPAHSDGHRITWTGDADEYTSRTINNIDASTTPYVTGIDTFDFDVSLPAGSGAAAGQFIIVKEASGGTNPNLVKGCHLITWWDYNNNIATVTVARNSNSSKLPSGTITANVTLVRTVSVTSTAQGIYSTSGKHCGNWNNMVFRGCADYVGVWLLNQSKIVLQDNFATAMWEENLKCMNSTIEAKGSVHSFAFNYIVSASDGGFVTLRAGSILSGAAGLAARAYNNGMLDLLASEVCYGGYVYNVQALQGGFVSAQNVNVEGCATTGSNAFYVTSGGGIDSSGATNDAATARGQESAPGGNGSYHVY